MDLRDRRGASPGRPGGHCSGRLSHAAPSIALGVRMPDEETGSLEHRVKQDLAKATPCRLPDSLVRASTPAHAMSHLRRLAET